MKKAISRAGSIPEKSLKHPRVSTGDSSAVNNTYHSASGNYSPDTNTSKNIPTFPADENKRTAKIIVKGRTFPKIYL